MVHEGGEVGARDRQIDCGFVSSIEAAAPPHRKESAEVIHLVRMPPGCPLWSFFLGTSYWEEAREHAGGIIYWTACSY